ncbi:clathrin coat assembly protein AP180-like [Arachis hypogaea]|uniref:clathrin coat assembly protein AP180-like n=1 Tax=Arachis hypogaea TaxID=3818 RepID=UPI000DED22A7|nr:clathrin coat assembly protein AP180-like [Arachis hypogaea]QHO36964.1 Clathrin coat assembly protein [Arachis hypogaea]
MPSKLRKAIGAVKDQTSISLAKVTNAANLEVMILKATTHDKNQIEERYINEIVQIVSSNKLYAAACAQAISKRIGKTRNWVVALKSLMIVLRIFQDGDVYFPKEVFLAMKQGARILNLSNFRDDSGSSPWDYTAFVRTFALYLDERLYCFLTGKLQRRFAYHHDKNHIKNDNMKDMKPSIVLDRVVNWQKLLDRAIGTRPTGSAKGNRVVQVSLYAVLLESFDLYRDISDGIGVVLDSFFHLPYAYAACVAAYKACDKSCKQFEELSAFYGFCKGIGIGRSYEYPTVQKVSRVLMETLQEFLEDQASFSTNDGSKPNRNLLHAGSSSSQDEKDTCSNNDGSEDEKQSQEVVVDDESKEGWELVLAESTIAPEKASPKLANDFNSFVNFLDQPLVPPIQYNPFLDPPIQQSHDDFQGSNSMTNLDVFFGVINTNEKSEANFDAQHQDFQNRNSSETIIAPTFNVLSFQSTLNMIPMVFEAESIHNSVVAPTFRATNSNEETLVTPNEDDPFETWSTTNNMVKTSELSNQEQTLFQQQQLWLEHQSRIMAKYMT